MTRGFNITDLKKAMGPGLGLRKNKYLIEIPIPGISGETLNILCRSAGLPEITNTTVTIFKYGRKYTMRGEADFTGSYEISIVDDSNMKIRKLFDKWMKLIDNTKPKNQGIFAASYEDGVGEFLENARSVVGAINNIKEGIQNPDNALDYFLGFIDFGIASSSAPYQADINIWQLNNSNDKVYGYKLQNAFPNQVGVVTLDDNDENTVTEFSVNFSFSEFIPLSNDNMLSKIGKVLGGDTINDIISGF